MMRYWLTVALLLALATPALAQLEDSAYVTKFFGTTAAFAFDKPVTTESGWWGDMLPAGMTTDNVAINTLVNDLRTKNKLQPLLGPDEYVLLWGQEGTNTDGKYYYTIDFQGLRPSEVTAVFDSYGGAQKILPGATLSFWPMNKRNFYFSALNPGEPISCFINGTELGIKPDQAVTEAKKQILSALSAQFGAEMTLDVYLNQYVFADGGGGADLSVYAVIPTDLVPALQYPTGGDEAVGE
jgi:hypothetical protein